MERPEPKSPDEHFKNVYASYLQKERRDPLKDSRVLLDLLNQRGFKFEIEVSTNIPDMPSLIVANHHIRPLLSRQLYPIVSKQKVRLSTAADIILTSSVIGVGTTEFSKRSLIFAQAADVSEGLMCIKCLDRKTQSAFLDVYGFIPVYPDQKKNSRAAFKIIRALKSGQNVAIYPEGVVNLNSFEGLKYLMHPDRLRQFNNNIESLLKIALRGGFQILPVSVYTDGRKNYHATFHEPITSFPDNSSLSQHVIETLGSKIPGRLHGYYKGQIAS